jgi:hypothetical protein
VTFWNTYMDFVKSNGYYEEGGYFEEYRKDLFNKTININSSVEVFDVNIKDDLKIFYSDTTQPIYVEVKFTEASTGQVIEAFAHLKLLEYGYEMFLTGSEILVPNQPYNFKVSLRRIGTGVPVSQTDEVSL